MKKFDIPIYYKSSFISAIKNLRKDADPRKKDFSPTLLDFGSVQFLIARHFGFCYGVENAIEIAYRAVEENPGKRIFLLSQMIHNPIVNQDLQEKGIQFIMDTEGNQLIEWEALNSNDIILIPAFGTTIEIEAKINAIGLQTEKYNTTCPFVEKVWKQSEKLGKTNHTIIIHGKHKHEETRATFSHSYQNAPSIIIKDMNDAAFIAKVILGEIPATDFYEKFKGRLSEGFDVEKHFEKIGVVNQTTMLATETQAIADYFKQVMLQKYGEAAIKNHFADTRDTLCYATNDNQQATYALLEEPADFAIVVGGYNSSNTSHIVELCEEKLPTYFISSANEIENQHTIHHFNYNAKQVETTNNFIPEKQPVRIILTSGASCPDTLVDAVLDKLLSYFNDTKTKEEVLAVQGNM
ncbi:MAG: 4-hydroxy-3-methylbut-2-enyl diphosphate reductase [Flavobacteriales bacterium]|nr:4-hydroxy-3-methylbut-2-enyl diphosphate reductase [Flavobacteriales bacterium]MCW8912393.1 4-hydroxy-3-methylbut-2-enyl diphosphate reductase [Flavobacteriales bacterium]MCW8936477.1 4-hydroxy-3-methylbut-2-enyl diphosphate reductase [Flavobacteriales bacterium]MCW8967543.1 4-hydroxy-3-methylbut-2-enyl diphosphate reductase [Flavobacteriales bacterium]MCW8989532.1 4-hydroxy-3-methylbut-2-enyl diphosphate reductase [Flavobacteriales bacterium]